MPVWLIFAGGIALGAWGWDKLTGATVAVENAAGSAANGLVKLAVVGGAGWAGYQLYKHYGS